MRTIHKYALHVRNSETKIVAPTIFEPLHVAIQGDTLCLWAEVETESEPMTHVISVIGTGMNIYDPGQYVGSLQEGPLVWHVYHGGEI